MSELTDLESNQYQSKECCVCVGAYSQSIIESVEEEHINYQEKQRFDCSTLDSTTSKKIFHLRGHERVSARLQSINENESSSKIEKMHDSCTAMFDEIQYLHHQVKEIYRI